MAKILRVYGPPGTGKTTELRRRVRSAVERGFDPERIILTSMSRTAAKQLLETRPDDEPLPIPATHIGTMHSLCYRQLVDLYGKKIEIAEAHLDEFCAEHPAYQLKAQKAKNKLDEPETDYEFDGDEAVLQEYNSLRARMIPRNLWPRDTRTFAERFDDWKTAHSYLDFTDLIETCLHDAYLGIPFRAEVLIADEAQDFTKLQHALFEKWAQHADYCVMAGDDDQTIFGHTGATAADFVSTNAPTDSKVVLSQSNRVPAYVHAIAESWIRGVTLREPKEYAPRASLGRVRTLDASWRNPDWLIEDVEKQIAANRSCMILASCSYMLPGVIAGLRERGIPFSNRWRISRGDWNPLTTNGVSMADRMRAFLALTDDHIWTWRELDAWTEPLEAKGALQRGAKSEIDGRASDKATKHDEVDATELMKLLSQECFERAYEGDLAWWRDHVLPTHRKSLDYPFRVFERFGINGLSAQKAVTVGTIHSVKGGEAQVVYLFPDISRAAMTGYVDGGEARDAVIRQFYVGITRPIDELVVCKASGTDAVQLPLHAVRNVKKATVAA